VSIPDVENVVAADYVGIATGNKVENKIEKAGWHAEKSELVNAPLFLELPMALECKVKSYDTETCRLVGEIVNVSCDEEYLTDGKIDPDKLMPITYDSANHTYRVIGEVVGKAFSDGLRFKK
jgi:flavin reductase (DIM6/NTAB) family NADH-FMN oxidoreductase RutF